MLFFAAHVLEDSRVEIAIQPLGPISTASVRAAKAGIERMYNAHVTVLKSRPLPAAAFYKPRSRYRAEILLGDLQGRTPNEYAKVVGLTAKDISTTKGKVKDWGVLGLGQIGQRPCVVSTFRMHTGQVTSKTFRFRLQNTVNHELGHTFGLEHCPHIPCVMNDARGSIKPMDNHWNNFCSLCKRRISRVLN